MKQFLPYNVLLVMAVALMGTVIFYNLVLRETFAVTVAYTLPAAPKPEAAKAVSVPEPDIAGEDTEIGREGYENTGHDGAAAITGVTFPLDLNLATEEELRFIPRIGEITSQRIVQYRDALGGYESLDQLKDIKGIGDETFNTISAYLVINTDETDDNKTND